MNTEENLDRGGFQNRDVGRSNFSRNDFGPESGVDFALYSAENDILADETLKSAVRRGLDFNSAGHYGDVEIHVRNGFVFLKGPVQDEITKKVAEDIVSGLPGVLKVINVLSIRYQ
jgi:hypothetical protein